MAAIKWSPDYSSFVNLKDYPDADWHDADPGGGSEGAQGSAAGWFRYNEGGSGSEGYTPPSYTRLDVPATNFNRLKEAGLWDLKDPNSDTWKYLKAAGTTPNDAAYGRWADPKTDPNALYRAMSNAGLMDVAKKDPSLVANNARSMLDGLNPEFVDKFSQAASNNASGYWDSIKNNDAITFKNFSNDMGDAARVFRDMFTQTPLGVAAGAIAGPLIAGAAGGGATGAAAAGGALGAGSTALRGGDFSDILKSGALGAAGGAVGNAAVGSTGATVGAPSDMSWLDGMGDSLGGFTTNPSLGDLGGDTSAWSPGGVGYTADFGATGALGGSGMDDMSWLDGIGDPIGDFTTNPSLGDLGGDTSWWSPGGGGDPFVDNWDMLPNSDTVYQTPGELDLPLPNGGLTGGAVESAFSKYGSQAVDLAKKILGGSGGAEALKALAQLGVPAAIIGGLFEKNQSPLVGPMKQAAEGALTKANEFGALQGPGITPSQQKAIAIANEDPAWKGYFDKAGALVDSGTAALDPAAIDSYVNPYLQGALDPAIRDIQRASDTRRQALRAQVAKSGNDFRTPGTNRFNVEDNLLDETTLQEIGDLSGKMHADAYNYATGLAKSDKDRALTGAGAETTLGKGAGALQTNDISNLTQAGALERQPYEDTRANLGDTTKLLTGVVHGTAPALGPTTPDSLLTKGAGALGALKTAKDLELF